MTLPESMVKQIESVEWKIWAYYIFGYNFKYMGTFKSLAGVNGDVIYKL